jgi:tRNA modification GTPase
MTPDTIFAPTTAPGQAAVAMVRLSGAGCAAVCRCLTGLPPPPGRRAALRRLTDPVSGEVLDRGLVLFFPAPASFTGEDVLELQIHGGRAVLAGVLDALADLPGLRAAEPGEFSRRAFLNGRLDLTAAEGLADLVAAETRAQASQALRQLEGGLGRRYDHWRERLLAALARLEAAIDFASDPRSSGCLPKSPRISRTASAANACARGSRSPWSGRRTPASRAWSIVSHAATSQSWPYSRAPRATCSRSISTCAATR